MELDQVFERAKAANRGRRHQRALELCNIVLNNGEEATLVAGAHHERARAFAALGDWSRAELECRAALATHASPPALLLLTNCLFERERFDEAASVIRTALDDEAAPARAWELAARVFAKQGQRSEALAAAQQAHELDPSLPQLKTLARALSAAGRHDEAIARLQARLAQTEGDAELWTVLGMSFYSSGDSERAVAALLRATELEPEHVDAHCGLAWVLLRLGRYAEGFEHHEYRLKQAGNQRRFGIAPWRGEDLRGKSILVWSEQGYGDTMQFARFMPSVTRLAARTTLHVPPTLARLFAANRELGPVDGRMPAFCSAEYQAPLMSLPKLLGVGDELFAGRLPCLVPESERVARFRARLPPGPKVGFAFQGNPRYGGEPWRSMPFAELGPLFERFGADVTFISLQKHVGREQLAATAFAGRVLDLGDEIDRGDEAFLDSLAILPLLDAFITTDSALAHLAGSAGIPAWILLSHAPDWRWGTLPERTAWYPTLRLFRQARAGDWASVVERVGDELAVRLAQRG